MSIYNLTPTPMPYSSLPIVPESSAKSPPSLLTTLRAHQTMLAAQYEAQYAGYLNTLSTLTAVTEAKELVTLLLDQQREVMLFQKFLGDFQEFVDALEGRVELKVEGRAEVIGKDGGIGNCGGVGWKGVHGLLR